MRPLAALALFLAAAGCMGPDAASGDDAAPSPTVTPAPPTRDAAGCPQELPADATSGGRPVHVYVGNDAGYDTCVRIVLDGRPIVASDVAAAPQGLHASPKRLADTYVPEPTARFQVEETAGGFTHDEVVELPPEAWVVVSIASGGISVQVHDEEPQFT